MIEREIEQIKDVFVETISPVKIYLFGSFADGTSQDDSDYGCYIVVKDELNDLAALTA
ncbi:MAG: nucleotidyltransferase domain-containing protein [Lachnospiraceae bacterium]|nr:nucleotidyltransferase domain-containing protein [Lachnospiraceae bacterium]